MKKTAIAILVTALINGGVFFIASSAIKKDTKFVSNFHPAVESTVGSDGRAAVGGPAYWEVQISPALCWAKGDNGVKAWRLIAWLLILGTAVYVVLADRAVITGNIHIGFVLLAISAACYFGAYSSAYANNTKKISVQQFELIKDDKAALEQLFSGELIK